MVSVSSNGRYLQHADGSPYFYLADTAWQLLRRLDPSQTDHYLQNRAAKGFTAIQTVALTELEELDTPTPGGQIPLHDGDPTRPNDAFFDHVEFVIDRAGELGMHLALLPTWGRWMAPRRPSQAHEAIFTPESAHAYGQYLGERFREKEKLIWVIGGDRPIRGHAPLWRALAEGIKAGGAPQLMTYHPAGASSSTELHHEHWLDFNMAQSGHHSKYGPNYEYIEDGYGRKPTKPVLDGEPAYENISVCFCAGNGVFGAHDIRVGAYWAVFAGACGHTYGCHEVWQMHRPGDPPKLPPVSLHWDQAIDLPGAGQVQHLKHLMLSRPYFDRIPDQAPLMGHDKRGRSVHLRATRDGTPLMDDATYLMVYGAFADRWTKVRTACIAAPRLRIWLYNPATGEAALHAEVDNPGIYTYAVQQTWGPDFVLVFDDASQDYPPPGTRTPA